MTAMLRDVLLSKKWAGREFCYVWFVGTLRVAHLTLTLASRLSVLS